MDDQTAENSSTRGVSRKSREVRHEDAMSGSLPLMEYLL